jgi:hypothetical protein
MGSTDSTSKTTITGGVVTINNNQAGVLIGNGYSGSTSTTALIPLVLSTSYNTSETASTCTASVNNGALYYNSEFNTMRACINGSWQDLVSTADLALQLFGVVPNSGPSGAGGGIGDLIGVSATTTANTGGPCKVSFDNSLNTSVYINACLAYTGGREVSWAGGAIAAPSGASTYQNVCFTAAGAPALLGSSSTTWTSESTGNLTTTNATTYGQPNLCLATLETGSTSGNMSGGKIYDIRTFTTTLKTYATIATAANGYLGALVSPAAGGLVVYTPGTSLTSLVSGVVVANSGAAGSAGAPNLIIATEGPQWMVAASGGSLDFITPSATGATQAGMGVATAQTGADAYDDVGINLNTSYATGCSTAAYGTSDCNYSDFAYMTIQ